jgi:hypothetical protein
MCFIINCEKCNKNYVKGPLKKSWGGCGKHLQYVRNAVPIEERCQCKPWH